MTRAKFLFLFLFLANSVVGCGGGGTNAPTAEFSDEQMAAIAAEDAAVADEEMGGGMRPVKRKQQK